jgi:hypothetical protein
MGTAWRDGRPVFLVLRNGPIVHSDGWVSHWDAWSGGGSDVDHGIGYSYNRRIPEERCLGWWPVSEPEGT